jgi:hypothetical protein
MPAKRGEFWGYCSLRMLNHNNNDNIPLLLLEKAGEDLDNLVTDIGRRLVAAEVLRPEPESTSSLIVEHDPDSLLDDLGLRLLAERVPEHERDGEDGSDRVGNVLTGDVGGGTVDGLVETGDAGGAVGDATEGCGGEETKGTGDDGGFVGEDVAEEVLSCRRGSGQLLIE